MNGLLSRGLRFHRTAQAAFRRAGLPALRGRNLSCRGGLSRNCTGFLHYMDFRIKTQSPNHRETAEKPEISKACGQVAGQRKFLL